MMYCQDIQGVVLLSVGVGLCSSDIYSLRFKIEQLYNKWDLNCNVLFRINSSGSSTLCAVYISYSARVFSLTPYLHVWRISKTVLRSLMSWLSSTRFCAKEDFVLSALGVEWCSLYLILINRPIFPIYTLGSLAHLILHTTNRFTLPAVCGIQLGYSFIGSSKC